MSSLLPREPTKDEVKAIVRAVIASSGLSIVEAHELFASARIAVLDNFVSDGPGYAGRVAFVLYSGGPDCVETYVFNADESARRAPTNREGD